jgi:hypothetical protein
MKIRYEFVREPSGKTEFSEPVELKTVEDYKNLLKEFYDYTVVAIDSIIDTEEGE